MSSRTKTILIVLGVAVLLFSVMCIVCGVFGASSCQQWADHMRVEGSRVQGEADTFAASTDQEGCLDEGFRRDALCADGTIECHSLSGVFTERCLQRASPVAGICEGVPPLTEIMRSAEWAVAECTERGRAGEQFCPQLLQSLQRYCQRGASR